MRIYGRLLVLKSNNLEFKETLSSNTGNSDVGGGGLIRMRTFLWTGWKDVRLRMRR